MEILHLLICFVIESAPSNRIMRHAFTFVSTWQYMKTGLKLVKFNNSLSMYKTWSIPGIWMKEAFFKVICFSYITLLVNLWLGFCRPFEECASGPLLPHLQSKFSELCTIPSSSRIRRCYSTLYHSLMYSVELVLPEDGTHVLAFPVSFTASRRDWCIKGSVAMCTSVMLWSWVHISGHWGIPKKMCF